MVVRQVDQVLRLEGRRELLGEERCVLRAEPEADQRPYIPDHRIGDLGSELAQVLVREDEIENHLMHREYFEVDESVCEAVRATRARGGRVIAVGTTAVRSLESASRENGEIQPLRGDTDIFIFPGYRFRSVDAMLTNFHLPESTLLMLVSAFAGREPIMAAYAQAIVQQYRFFSYGDAMFITANTQLQGPV